MTADNRNITETLASSSRQPGIRTEVLDELLQNHGGADGLTGPDGLLKRLMGALVSRAMEAELSHHLGYAAGEKPASTQENRRNGRTAKTLRTDLGPVGIEVPRDRDGTFEPKLVPKHQRTFDGFDDKILSMYGRGMSTREIQAHLKEIYGVDVSPSLVSEVTDAVIDELRQWQNRPLEATYLIVYLDALFVKIRDKGGVQNKAVYVVVGVGSDGTKDVLGLWVEATEGARFWMGILNDLKQRGVSDILVLCADGLTGLPAAVEAVFPKATFQTCIVHMVRSSTRFVPWDQRREVSADLRAVYTAANIDDAEFALEAFDEKWGNRFPMITRAWRNHWEELTPFLTFPQEIRRAIYTTNAIEGLNRQLRKALKTRGHMPHEDAALKLLYLAIKNTTKWGKPGVYWSQALLQFAIYFEGRVN